MNDKTEALGSPASDTVVATRLRKLVDVLPLGVFVTGEDHGIRWMNREAKRLLGIEGREVEGQRCEDILHCAFCGSQCAADDAREACQARRDFPVEILAAGTKEMAVRIDAFPLAEDEVAVVLRDVSETETLRRTLKEREVFHGLVQASAPMKSVVSSITTLAPTDVPVLVLGEAGTEKEAVARALHAEGPWWAEPFLVVRCAGVPAADLEATLFGSSPSEPGALERAEGGTVFLTSLDAVPPGLQARLATALGERIVRRPGDEKSRPLEARIVAAADATGPGAETWLHDGLRKRFAENRIVLLPLRDRSDDVPGLAESVLPRAARRAGRTIKGFTDDAMAVLKAHPWPGNTRQLEQVVDIAATRVTNGHIQVKDLPPEVRAAAVTGPDSSERVCDALRRAAGSVTRAAGLLGVHRTTLWRWMGAAGLSREDFFPA